jgi:hypothetical protein
MNEYIHTDIHAYTNVIHTDIHTQERQSPFATRDATPSIPEQKSDGPVLKDMYHQWPFFNTNIDLVDMILAKAESEIAGACVCACVRVCVLRWVWAGGSTYQTTSCRCA